MSGVGTQLIAPDGFGSLQAGERYYFLCRDAERGSVTLCWFARHRRVWRVHLLRLPADQFESAVTGTKPTIRRAPVQHPLPPWLEEVEDLNFDELELVGGDGSKRTPRERVEDRFGPIADLVESGDAILASDDPLKEIAKHAAACSPPQHPHRVQTWFFAYWLHGRNIWALMTASHLSGRWDRSAPKHRTRKFGRPSKGKGSAYGHSIHVMRKPIIKAYLRLCGLGRTMRAIHREALKQDFRCKVIRGPDGKKTFVQLQGEPFPSYGQFRRAILEKYGLQAVQKTRWGEAGFRTNIALDQGAFTTPFANLLESLVVDAYYVKERPRDLLTGRPMPPLCVVRGVCATSGNRCGIGFAYGRERAQAYREMLFSMAIPKDVLGRLYGVPIDPADWTSIGVTPGYVSDRGPGAADKLIRDLEARFPVREIPPSYSGQSKAIVESTHPRDDDLEGEPTFVLSHLNSIEMARGEVLQTVSDNHRSNISPRLTPQMVADFDRDGLLPTPFHLWNYLDARYRTDAVSLSLEQAVRMFLSPVVFKVHDNRVWLYEQAYDASALHSSGGIGSIPKDQTIELRGYALTMATRYAWVEVKGRLVEVEAQLRLRDDDEQLYLSLSQLEARGEKLAALNSRQREYADMAVVEASENFEACTGKAWIGGTRIAGRPKKPKGAAKTEADRYAARGQTKKAA